MSTKVVEALKKEGVSKMSVEDRRAMEHELAEVKDQLKRAEPGEGTAPRPELLQAVPQLKAKQKKLEEMLNKDDDLVPKGEEKDRLKKRAKELEVEIKKHNLTEREQALMPKSGMDFERAVQHAIDFKKKCEKLVEEWQELMRRLEPEDPNAADVRKLM